MHIDQTCDQMVALSEYDMVAYVGHTIFVNMYLKKLLTRVELVITDENDSRSWTFPAEHRTYSVGTLEYSVRFHLSRTHTLSVTTNGDRTESLLFLFHFLLHADHITAEQFTHELQKHGIVP